MLKEKKADEKLLSIWWVLVLVVIGVGIIAGVSLFYSVKIDTRQVESEILAVKILDCVVKQGRIVDEVMQDGFNIFESCYLNKDIFDKSGLFYFNVSFYREGKLEKNFTAGLPDLYIQCQLRENAEAEQFSECTIKKTISSYGDKNFFVEIIAASNQIGKGV